MKLNLYKIECLLADRGVSMREAGFDYRWIVRAKRGSDIRYQTVKKIADNLGVRPEDITTEEVTS